MSSNAQNCYNGSPLPTSQLSSSSAASTSISLANNGTTGPSAANLLSGSCGAAELADSTGNNPALSYGGISYSQSGPLGSTSTSFNGSNAWGEPTASTNNPQTFTILARFSTTYANVGIFGFSSQTNPTTGNPADHDRMLWIDSAGYLVWGVYNNAVYELASATRVDTGSWFSVAATMGSAGMALYVNGSQVASSGTPTTAQSYTGWWSLGYTATSGWTDPPSSEYYHGSMAQVAVLPSQLTSSQVSTLNSYGTLSAYTSAVNAFNPSEYWPLNDSGTTVYTGAVPGYSGSNSTVSDISGSADNATIQGTVTLGAAGPTSIGASSATFDGSTGYLQTANAITGPQGFSAVIWFKSATSGGTTGGSMFGFDNLQSTTAPGNWDRMLYLDNSGKLVWGVYNGSTSEVVSSSAYNNAAWHMAVAEVGTSGERLWVDGALVASNSSVTSAQAFTGYWHIGWAYTTSWPDPPTDTYFAGSLSEMAVIPTQLSQTQISALYGESSTTQLEMDESQLAPNNLWPMQESSVGICSTVEATVQQTVSATTTCLYPAGAGSCPAPSTSHIVTGIGLIAAVSPPKTAAPTSIQLSFELSAAPATALVGLDIAPEIGFGAHLAPGQWSAAVSYPGATVQL